MHLAGQPLLVKTNPRELASRRLTILPGRYIGQRSENNPFDQIGPSSCRIFDIAWRVYSAKLAGHDPVVTDEDRLGARRDGLTTTKHR